VNSRDAVVIAGGDPVGRRLAEMLRHHGHAGDVTLLGTAVTAIDRDRRRVELRDGTTHPYDRLVLATGTTAVPGLLHGFVRGGGTAAVLGDGPAAVETAARLAERGIAVTMVCAGPHPMAGRIDARCAAILAASIPAVVVADADPAALAPGPERWRDGSRAFTGTVLRCPDPVPDVRLARAAGLHVRQGVLIDEAARTSDRRIHAIGGCAEYAGRTVCGAIEAWEQADSLAYLIAGRGRVSRPPGADVLRLRTAAIDLTCAGAAAALPGDRTVQLTDPAGRRYARIVLRDDRVVAAVLLGLPRAAAVVAHSYRYGRPMPSDRLGLLLGLAPGRDDDAGTGPIAPVCLCNNVTLDHLHNAWRQGHRGREALARRTRVGTGCGGCRDEIDDLCARWQREEAAT
jgi:assimilatory nitrate reductase electron transfer subunit